MKLPVIGKQIILLCSILLFSTLGFSQRQSTMMHNEMTTQAILQKNMGKDYENDIEGSPYYDETFNSAKILPIGKVFMVRYNVALDVMEVIQKTDTLVMNKAYRNYTIKQNKGNITYKILENAEAKQDKLGYYIQLTNGEKIKLYRKDKKKFVEVTRTAYGSTTTSTSAKYKEQKSEFYIEYGDSGSAVKLPKKKKSLIKLFASKQGDIKSFIKKNKIKLTKEQDLVRLINYANSL
ncbi:hypothetical protein KORDIASMS9_00722 [Kordia sp. SMS9]|uniref:hypothetical protein n=1 Tax=Kordia sp. SMS9 TaxID=2282170 RepID=UPI000E103A8B|nr:hypothetical protein [Kordia sp. SMS9]AXG68507.1 hypothetical protein KORDIASMS9_00722 [Kordia sp. SMS9]